MSGVSKKKELRSENSISKEEGMRRLKREKRANPQSSAPRENREIVILNPGFSFPIEIFIFREKKRADGFRSGKAISRRDFVGDKRG